MTTAAERFLQDLSPADLARLDDILADLPVWSPASDPQRAAINNKADMLLVGGSAGGGKTALLCGIALTQVKRSLIVRRESKQLTGVIDEIASILGHRDGLNTQAGIWRLPGDRTIEFGAVANPGDWSRYQGRAKEALLVDEATNVPQAEVMMLRAWVRATPATVPGTHLRTVLASNPPLTIEGRWVTRAFAPWVRGALEERARPGELRYAVAMDGNPDFFVDGPAPFMHKGERITPHSRTFIPSRLQDNIYLKDSGYGAALMALPERQRRALLYGSFDESSEDEETQLIPSEWVKLAMERNQEVPPSVPLRTIGVDVARTGRDATILALRHGSTIKPLVELPKNETMDGYDTAAGIMKYYRPSAHVAIDAVGIGASPLDVLMRSYRVQVMPVNSSWSPTAMHGSNRVRYNMLKAQLADQLRARLDPAGPDPLTLPPDDKLLEELCALRYKNDGTTFSVSTRAQLIEALGRSPDRLSATMMSLLDKDPVDRIAVSKQVYADPPVFG